MTTPFGYCSLLTKKKRCTSWHIALTDYFSVIAKLDFRTTARLDQRLRRGGRLLEDSISKIYPHSGTDTEFVVVDSVAVVVDGAAGADVRSAVRTAAGRPQPPPAGGFAIY